MYTAPPLPTPSSPLGESQERERVMVYFSERYFECNPDTFPSPGGYIIVTIESSLDEESYP